MERHFEIRQVDDGAVEGVVMKYGSEGRLRDGSRERFEPRAIKTLPPVVVYVDHQPNTIVAVEGAGLELQHSDSALDFRMTMPRPHSDVQERALANVQAGLLRYASVTFESVRERMENGVRVIESAVVPGFSLVANPAYRESHLKRSGGYPPLQYRSEPVSQPDHTASGGVLKLENRQGVSALSGLFRFGIPTIISLARKTKLLIPADASLEFAPDVLLVDGFNYERRFAGTDAGSLLVEKTADGIAFATVPRKLARSSIFKEVEQSIRSGLTKGLVPGLQRADSDSYVDADGYQVERIRRGSVCELYLTARGGEGYGGELDSRISRRRRL